MQHAQFMSNTLIKNNHRHQKFHNISGYLLLKNHFRIKNKKIGMPYAYIHLLKLGRLLRKEIKIEKHGIGITVQTKPIACLALMNLDFKREEILDVQRTIIKAKSCVFDNELDLIKVQQNHQQQQ